MAAPQKIIELVERFDQYNTRYKSTSYNETQVRREFIDPFFKELGWDVDNSAGRPELFKEVIHEDAVKVGGKTKAPDYSFRTTGLRHFFVEAKKPAVNLKDNPEPAYQLRRYAWSAKLPISILTDFEEFIVYDCTKKPSKTDKSSLGRTMYFTFKEYVEKWDEIESLFSKKSIIDGKLYNFTENLTKKRGGRGTAGIDDAFLEEIEGWRDILAKNIALRNKNISVRELNLAVQTIIDRIVFLRICEDRGIEKYEQLKNKAEGNNIYKSLRDLFFHADDKYNSGLFHFKNEIGMDEPDVLTPFLEIDDKILKQIITHLYYPESPYEFSVFPSDILGQVYEQFLGKVIRLTPSHQARIEEKPEVKKAGGVFYTPTYIVDYIVKNTVGKLVENKSPKEVSDLKILDPACGSGSFLLGAYQCLLDWHVKWYMENLVPLLKEKKTATDKDVLQLLPVKPATKKKGRGKKRVAGSDYDFPIYKMGKDDWRLTSEEKKRILLNNIYGVDIDQQAVEVTKLSLLLKVLEGEKGERISKQLTITQERVLPSLHENIKCGNSLIGPDIYSSVQMTFDDEEEFYRINAFDWNREFTAIFEKGGFDAVIGNPPYVDVKLLGDDIKQILSKYFSSATRRFDLYVPFVEQGMMLLSKNGILGYIIPSMFTRREYGRDLRKTINKLGTIEGVVDFGTNQVFKTAMNYVGIFIIGKSSKQNDVPIIRCERTGINENNLQRCLIGEKVEGVRNFLAPANIFNTSDEWYFLSREESKLINRLFNSFISLGSIISHASEGIHSGKDNVFFVPKKTVHNLNLETPPVYPLAKGKDVHRYQAIIADNLGNFVIYPYNLSTGKAYNTDTLQDISPNTWDYLNKSKNLLKGRGYFDKSNKLWYELWCPRNPLLYTSPKIVGPEIASRGEFTLCKEQLFVNNKLKVLILHDGVNEQIEYILGLLNSSLLCKLHRLIAPPKGGGFFEVKTLVISRLPIRTIDFSNPDDVSKHDKIVSLVEQMLELNKKLDVAKLGNEKEMIKRRINATDDEINSLVYELYGLTDEEIKIVEG